METFACCGVVNKIFDGWAMMLLQMCISNAVRPIPERAGGHIPIPDKEHETDGKNDLRIMRVSNPTGLHLDYCV